MTAAPTAPEKPSERSISPSSSTKISAMPRTMNSARLLEQVDEVRRRERKRESSTWKTMMITIRPSDHRQHAALAAADALPPGRHVLAERGVGEGVDQRGALDDRRARRAPARSRSRPASRAGDVGGFVGGAHQPARRRRARRRRARQRYRSSSARRRSGGRTRSAGPGRPAGRGRGSRCGRRPRRRR